MLAAQDRPLAEVYDLAMFDLDGVVYIGADAVVGAPDHLARARASGLHVAFVTNNASRPPDAVARKLSGLGVEAATHDVVTSAQAAARVLLDRFGTGGRVAVLGAAGLERALVEAGLEVASVNDEDVVALVTGYGPDVPWRDVMRAAVRLRAGLPWVTSNTDLSLPTRDGIAPGHGVMVRMLADFSGVTPTVAGKPERPLLDETVRRVGGERPLMVGDRLDTDIEGGHNAGVDTLLVLTGVTGLEELVAARPEERPTYLSPDLGGLFSAHPEPHRADDGWRVNGWTASTGSGTLATVGDGEVADWWRAVAAAAWDHLDRTGDVVDTAGAAPPSATPDG